MDEILNTLNEGELITLAHKQGYGHLRGDSSRAID